MYKTLPRHFSKRLVALAVTSALMPQVSRAVNLSTAPPGVMTPYVAPNVIISIDDSGSMDYQINSTQRGLDSIVAPNAAGVWDTRAKRVNVLKFALNQVFTDTNLLPDGQIRLAWQAMWNNGNSPGVGSSGANSVVGSGSGVALGINTMKPLSGGVGSANTHRQNFLNFVTSLSPLNGTPTHRMFSQADAYMRRPLSPNGPWSANPGGTDSASTKYLACRRNYHIVFTDGRWNGAVSGGSRDSNTVNRVLPDGTVYGSTSAANRPNNILYSDGFSNTLADWAFESWSNPLQNAANLEGAVTVSSDYLNAPNTENFGLNNASPRVPAILNKYWNPRYNPASWPHMVTYTIGISNDATTWNATRGNNIVAPTQRVPFGFDGSFPDLVTGRIQWPNMGLSEDIHALDLWHAALNGRGQFYSVMTGADLQAAFRSIIQNINTATSDSTSTGTASGSNASNNDVGVFTASYDPVNAWAGKVTGALFNKTTTVQPPVDPTAPQPPANIIPGWGGRDTAQILDAMQLGNRVVLSWGDKALKGIPFQWASDESNLSALQKNALQVSADGPVVAEERLQYIRGDRSKEIQNGGTFRNRTTRQGDIVNSEVWYTGIPSSTYAYSSYLNFVRANKNREAMIYVGGNDGILHGFSAVNGVEKIAYVPRGVISNLSRLTQPSFDQNHIYYVDGSPMTGDVNLAGNATVANWRTMMVGTLGGGGKGYFVLDVTNPSNFSEGNAQNLVVLDKTIHASEVHADCSALTGAAKTACDAANLDMDDLGYITAKPVKSEVNQMQASQIVRMNNDRWAVVMGNGYNSKNTRPVLLIQYLDGAKELVRLVATGNTTTATCSTNKLQGNACNNIDDNGLSAPRLVDVNGDGRPDIVYAGDNKGNMWKFLIASDDSTKWGVAQWGALAATTTNTTTVGTPLYTAKGGTIGSPTSRTISQPISAPPTVRINDQVMQVTVGGQVSNQDVGGMMVAFGTGRNVAINDPDDQNVQSIYSVLDNARYKLVGANKDRVEVCASTSDQDCQIFLKSSSDLPAPVSTTAAGTGPLVKQSVSSQVAINSNGRDFWTIDTPTSNWKMDWSQYKGWYMDLPQTGERLLKPMSFYRGSNILAVFSQVPARGSRVTPGVESCDVGSAEREKQYLTLLNIMDGKRPTVQIMDGNGDGVYNLASDLGVSRMGVSGGHHNMIDILDKDGNTKVKIDGTLNSDFPKKSVRPTWRQVK